MSTDAQTHAKTSRWLACVGALAVAALALIQPAGAATFPDLFTVTVDGDPTAADQRTDAMRRAMSVLLTRVSGRSNASAYPELAPLIAGAPGLVTSYGQVDDGRHRVGFSATRVQQQLAALDWPVWAAERPQLVLWAAIDFGNGQRALLTGEPAATGFERPRLAPNLVALRDGIRDELVRAADERGLPMQLPLMDERDAELASFAAVWGGFGDVLLGASARYAADFVLIARASLTDLGLSIEWTLAGSDGHSRRLLTSAPRDGIDWVADEFAAQFSSSGGPRQTVLDIEGIGSLAEYGRVMRYLETLSIVESIDVESYDGQSLRLVASIRGDDTVLDRVFGLDGVLESADSALAGGGFGLNRRFRLARDISGR